MNIFQLNKTIQASDNDGYLHWPESEPIAYYMNEDSAKAKIDELINQEALEYIDYPHVSKMIKDNKSDFYVGTSPEIETKPLYTIEVIEVLP
jgi:hypothetical protein